MLKVAPTKLENENCKQFLHQFILNKERRTGGMITNDDTNINQINYVNSSVHTTIFLSTSYYLGIPTGVLQFWEFINLQ